MAKATLQSAGIAVQASAEPVTLSGEVENTLCLILREAVTNVIRHSQATQVDLKGEYQGNAYHISVCDNGVGIANARPGNGMNNIELRAKHIFATAIYQNRQQGCCLHIEVNLND
ncbi:sensor histidine kinase [Salinibius halmophilus]|uniref:sensor histidine kinase n=1 Tax=Salinibius halmophilus TaxID=1853216 RepID=UPI000E6656FF|nr:ATP-binding protein [Salinibius halmophilus]